MFNIIELMIDDKNTHKFTKVSSSWCVVTDLTTCVYWLRYQVVSPLTNQYWFFTRVQAGQSSTATGIGWAVAAHNHPPAIQKSKLADSTQKVVESAEVAVLSLASSSCIDTSFIVNTLTKRVRSKESKGGRTVKARLHFLEHLVAEECRFSDGKGVNWKRVIDLTKGAKRLGTKTLKSEMLQSRWSWRSWWCVWLSHTSLIVSSYKR